MPVNDETQEQFARGAHGWDSSQWRKLALLWGYSDRLVTKDDDTIAAGTTLIQNHTAVPAGEVWRYVGFSMYNDTAACTCIIFANFGGTNYAISGPNAVPGGSYYVESPFDVVLKEGDYLVFSWAAVAVGERCISNAWGYKMDIAE